MNKTIFDISFLDFSTIIINYDVYTTQSISLENAHTYAKNLGTHFRAMADQDLDVYALLFSLFRGTVHTQGIYEGITNVNGTNWAAYNKSADGGASSYGQFHKKLHCQIA